MKRPAKKLLNKSENSLNEPDIPSITYTEQLLLDNTELSKAISRLKYHNLIVQEFLTDSQLEAVRRYAK